MAVDVIELGKAVAELLRELGHDVSPDSDGGKKLTAAEWAHIGVKLGLVGVEIVEGVVTP